MNQEQYDTASTILEEIEKLDSVIDRLANGDHCIAIKLPTSPTLDITSGDFGTSCESMSNALRDVAQARKRALELEFEAL